MDFRYGRSPGKPSLELALADPASVGGDSDRSCAGLRMIGSQHI